MMTKKFHCLQLINHVFTRTQCACIVGKATTSPLAALALIGAVLMLLQARDQQHMEHASNSAIPSNMHEISKPNFRVKGHHLICSSQSIKL